MSDLFYKCRLCGLTFSDCEMSEEHYPAKSVGNDDIVAVNMAEIFRKKLSPKFTIELKTGRI